MDQSLFEKFERQVEALLLQFDRVKKENLILREKQAQIVSERDTLVQKNRIVASTIERLIDKLKLIESNE